MIRSADRLTSLTPPLAAATTALQTRVDRLTATRDCDLRTHLTMRRILLTRLDAAAQGSA